MLGVSAIIFLLFLFFDYFPNIEPEEPHSAAVGTTSQVGLA